MLFLSERLSWRALCGISNLVTANMSRDLVPELKEHLGSSLERLII